jgi:hypothetical protein
VHTCGSRVHRCRSHVHECRSMSANVVRMVSLALVIRMSTNAVNAVNVRILSYLILNAVRMSSHVVRFQYMSFAYHRMLC